MHAKSHKEENTTHAVTKKTWNMENRKKKGFRPNGHTHHPDKKSILNSIIG
jgi:hypothetical protein